MKRRGVDWFCITTDDPIGNCRAVELWIDNRGASPSWKLEKIIVRDYYRYVEWVFMADIWFSLALGNPPLAHHILYQKVKKHVSLKNRIFKAEDLMMYHVYYGMLTREHCNAFSRKEKVAAVFSVLFFASLIALLQLGVDTAVYEHNDLELDYGYVKPRDAMIIGCWGLALAIVINYPLVYAIRLVALL